MLKSYLLNDLKNNNWLENMQTQKVEEEDAYFVFDNEEISEEDKKLFIEIVDFNITCSKPVSEEILKLIIDNNKLAYTIQAIYNASKILQEEQFDKYFSKENLGKMSFEGFDQIKQGENYQEFFDRVIYTKLANENNVEIFEKLHIEDMQLKESIDEKLDVYISRLVEHNILDYSPDNVLNHI